MGGAGKGLSLHPVFKDINLCDQERLVAKKYLGPLKSVDHAVNLPSKPFNFCSNEQRF